MSQQRNIALARTAHFKKRFITDRSFSRKTGIPLGKVRELYSIEVEDEFMVPRIMMPDVIPQVTAQEAPNQNDSATDTLDNTDILNFSTPRQN